MNHFENSARNATHAERGALLRQQPQRFIRSDAPRSGSDLLLRRSDFITKREPTAGFSRSDLLTTLAVLTLLVALHLASATGGSQATSAETCRNNLRRLTQAWLMYADDHQGRLAPGGSGGTSAGKAAFNASWMGGWLNFSSSFDSINTDLLVNPNRYPHSAFLGPYIQSNALLFRCPDDRSTITIFGRQQARSRSTSLNNWMGGSLYCSQAQYQLYRNAAEVTQPAQRWLLMDERADSINDALLQVDMINNLVDIPGFYHQGGTWVTFVDGRSEFKRWTDPRTLQPFAAGQLLPLNIPSPNNPDLDWLRERTTELR